MKEKKIYDQKSAGIQLIKLGELDKGIQQLKVYSEDHPDDLDVLTILGESYLKLQQSSLAQDYFSQALEINPTHTSNLINFSALELKGPNYLTALKSFHKRIKPKRYIEIGVCKGASFELVDPRVHAIGIDPDPQLDVKDLPEKHVVRVETSDSYFSSDKIIKDLEGDPFDMAFLDGMHLFEFALRDLMNLEKYSKPTSVVFIHDLYPMNAETAKRDRIADFWSGDVWKLVLCLQKYRPDLDLSILPCPPTGLGAVTKLDSNSTVLIDNYSEIIKEYIDMTYEEIKQNKSEKLKLLSIDEMESVMVL
ncbi:class I SAM-dependent methyltransferase [uncultured Cocleimonas sp.]|uniref:class I SAM-dependent methyltransferase n=1 Tax=uncultured Cocleimonas sp. TaxID=1051587 RepID=UPI00261B8A21|nr:class I SAM-dependent methyltransferase [uncultured Cocleimonas sp.]